MHRHLLQVGRAFLVVLFTLFAGPIANQRLTCSLVLQSSVTTVTATANASASAMSNDWSNVMGTLLNSNWSKLAPAAVQNFGKLQYTLLKTQLHPPWQCGICLADILATLWSLLFLAWSLTFQNMTQLALNQNHYAHCMFCYTDLLCISCDIFVARLHHRFIAPTRQYVV